MTSKKEQLANQLAKSAKHETLVRSMCTIDQSAFQSQLTRRRFEEQQEQANAQSLITNQEMADVREYKRLQVEKLAEQMNRHNRLNIRDEKLRQQIRESNQELRDLEVKLRSAYVGKGIRAQLAANEAKRLQEKVNCEFQSGRLLYNFTVRPSS